MKTAVTDKAVDAVVETTETAIDTVAGKTSVLTPKNLIIAAGTTLVVVGIVYGIKRFRNRQVEETE